MNNKDVKKDIEFLLSLIRYAGVAEEPIRRNKYMTSTYDGDADNQKS